MLQMASNYLRPTLGGGPGFKFLGINLNSPAAKQIVYLSWTLPWTIACILVLQIMSSPFELFFFLVSNQLIFSPKWQHVHLVSICYFLILDPCLKAMGPIYGSYPIKLLYFIGPWTLI